jgi:hypothetical protein
MSFKSVTNIITGYFKQVASANNLVVRYDDDPRDTPADDVWMEVSVNFGTSEQIAIGVNQFRNPGIFEAKIKQPVGSGISKLLETADIVVGAFRTAIISNSVNFQTPRVVNVGRDGDNHQVNVICPFFVDEN